MITPDTSELPATGDRFTAEEQFEPHRLGGEFSGSHPDLARSGCALGVAPPHEDANQPGTSLEEEIPTPREEGAFKGQPSSAGPAMGSGTICAQAEAVIQP